MTPDSTGASRDTERNGDPDCDICDGSGTMYVGTYNRRPTENVDETCVCVGPYRETLTCEGCGDWYPTPAEVAACSCWGDVWIDRITYALACAVTAMATADAA